MSTSAPATSTTSNIPRINEPAPDFEAKSTQGMLKLSDYKGQWVVLFSHPADFTPVCSTEFIEFARRADEFKKRGVQLIGLSVDSVPAHIAWIRNIEQHFPDVKITFPVIADLDTKVAQKYGLIHPSASDTATVRAVGELTLLALDRDPFIATVSGHSPAHAAAEAAVAERLHALSA